MLWGLLTKWNLERHQLWYIAVMVGTAQLSWHLCLWLCWTAITVQLKALKYSLKRNGLALAIGFNLWVIIYYAITWCIVILPEIYGGTTQNDPFTPLKILSEDLHSTKCNTLIYFFNRMLGTSCWIHGISFNCLICDFCHIYRSNCDKVEYIGCLLGYKMDIAILDPSKH